MYRDTSSVDCVSITLACSFSCFVYFIVKSFIQTQHLYLCFSCTLRTCLPSSRVFKCLIAEITFRNHVWIEKGCGKKIEKKFHRVCNHVINNNATILYFICYII